MDLENTPEEQRLHLLVNAVTDYAIYMLDPAGRVSTWNPGAERFKGYSRAEFSRFYTEEDRAADLPSRALRVAAREGQFEAEGWRVRKDGSRFWAHVVIDPIRDEKGQLRGFAKITRDVTKRREQEVALFESEQRFRLLIQGVRDCAIYMLDRDGRVSNWNAGAELIKGYTKDEIVGQHFSNFYTEEDRASGEPDRALDTALREGKYEREAWRVRKDGTLFWAHVLIDPIFNDEGEHVGFAKVTRDATERKKAQEQLDEARAALAQAQKLQALGELAGGVAHDFNNLMTIIVGASDFLAASLTSQQKSDSSISTPFTQLALGPLS
jgi:PAS domain S-box-containing protein